MTETLDAARAEAFGERMLGALNDAALILLTSLGQRTALFDTMAELPPSTSAQIADRAGLQERYVREFWEDWSSAASSTTTRVRGRTTCPPSMP